VLGLIVHAVLQSIAAQKVAVMAEISLFFGDGNLRARANLDGAHREAFSSSHSFNDRCNLS
jgi:hypothetical protein